MRYRNTVTGNVIDTECAIYGGNWQPLGAAGEAPAAREAVTETEPKEAAYDIDDDSDLEVDSVPAKAKGKKK